VDTEAAAIAAKVEAAFAAVARDGGTGLEESNVLDACAGESALLRARSQDDLIGDWRDIPDESLEYASQAMCFMDALGIRFHLPAYICWTLRNFKLKDSFVPAHTVYTLGNRDSMADVLPLLDEAQKAAIANFMAYAAQPAHDEWLDVDHAANALPFWRQYLRD
jgi:hypothetical protein